MKKMEINELIQQVDVERIYSDVLALEGPRYPLDDMEALNAAAEFIYKELEKLGFTAEYQEFTVSGIDTTFKNVLGYCGDRNAPAVVLGSHYDTVPDCPGANDNLSAVAIVLESARIISKLENPPPVIFAFFTLEEGHPGIAAKQRELRQKFGIEDNKKRFRSWELVKLHREVTKVMINLFRSGKDFSAGIEQFITQFGDRYSSEIQQYLEEWKSLTSEFSSIMPTEGNGLVGSNYFVNQLENPTQSIKYLINYDTVGWIYNRPKTQRPLPIPMDFMTMHKVDIEKEIGNFLTIITDANSVDLFNRFLENCKNENVDIPYVGVNLPMQYEDIKKQAPDTLRMDHAHFWRKQVPAITMADGAEFRTDLYHTPADTSKNMDFDMLAKIVKATLITVLESQS